MFKGTYKNYCWIEWQANNKFLGTLISEFPQIVLGKYLINTSFASGSLTLSDNELKRGWNKYNDLTISPAITDIESIPIDQFDEWYIFDSPKTFDNYEVLINYDGFSLQHPALAQLQERFWQQLDNLAPESYLAEGSYLIYVTRDIKLFNLLAL